MCRFLLTDDQKIELFDKYQERIMNELTGTLIGEFDLEPTGPMTTEQEYNWWDRILSGIAEDMIISDVVEEVLNDGLDPYEFGFESNID